MRDDQQYGPDEVRRAIASKSSIVDFGNEEHAVSALWLAKAEEVLGCTLTPSYKWFLMNYGGGEIGGEEIYSVYGMDFESAVGGDIVYQHLLGLRSGRTKPQELVVSTTDFGEVFFFDYSRSDGSECPLSLKFGSGEPSHYACNFYEFLCKRISALS